MARKKRQIPEEHENHERWLVTYADMVTLLMVLFIVMFSMASIDLKKFTALAESFSGGRGGGVESVIEGGESILDGGPGTDSWGYYPAIASEFDFPDPELIVNPETSANEAEARKALARQQNLEAARQAEANNLQQVKSEIQAALDAQNLGNQVSFKLDRRGLVVSVLTDKVLFPSGSAQFGPNAGAILEAIGKPLSTIPNQIEVQGHTDNVPINTPVFPSNWELSTARATSVLRYLVDHKDTTANRIAAAGYGETRPIADNSTNEGRAANRRVEVVILNSVPPGEDNG